MGSNRGRVPRGIHWNSKEGRAIVSRIRLSGRGRIMYGGDRKAFPKIEPFPRDLEVWFRNRGSDLVHRYDSGVHSICGVAGFFTGVTPFSELLRMQDAGRKPRYRFCSECVVWEAEW